MARRRRVETDAPRCQLEETDKEHLRSESQANGWSLTCEITNLSYQSAIMSY